MKAEETFSEMMKKARNKKGSSLRQLQTETGIQWSLLNMFENDKRPPTLQAASVIAQALALDEASAVQVAYQTRLMHCTRREREALVAFAKRRHIGLHDR